MQLNGFYNRFQQSPLGKALRLPALTSKLSTEAAYKTFPEVLELVKNVEMGNAYFVHLLLPHHPYKFNKECSLISERTLPESETNYQYYLEQVAWEV